MKMRLSVNVKLISNVVGQGLAPAVGLLLIYDNFGYNDIKYTNNP